MEIQNHGQIIAEVSGKPASIKFGRVAPAFLGQTTLRLFSQRVVEETKRIVSSRNSELLTREVDSVEITKLGNPLWLVLGFFTIALYGLGIIFFIVYFLAKHKFLIVHSKNNVQLVSIKGDETSYQRFMEAVLTTAETAKKGV